jgi:DNA repair exonuclease SbcCD ATPase subunit
MPDNFEDQLKSFQKQMADAQEEMSKKLKFLEDQVSAGQKLLDAHKDEMGKARKEINDAKQALEKGGANMDADKWKELIEKMSVIETRISGSTSDPSGGGGTGGTLEEIKKSMTERQKELADEKFKTLTPEQKTALVADEKLMKDFLGAASKAAPSIPESLFGDSTGNTEQAINQFEELFGIASKQSRNVPSSRPSGPSGFADASKRGKDKPTQTYLPGGIIPRPKAMEATG